MNIIKLDAIGSTNTYLKELSNKVELENFTVVSAEYQSEGRGQRGSSWVAERGSSLTFSVLLKDLLQMPQDLFDLNIIVPLAVVTAINKIYGLPCEVKWPNDIVSRSKKIGGILIENTFKSQGVISSVIGIGINLKQRDFSDFPQGSSIVLLADCQVDKEELLVAIVTELKQRCQALGKEDNTQLWEDYHNLLFRKGVISKFELPDGQSFQGTIIKVTREGLLVVQKTNGELSQFSIKEVKLVY